MLPKLASIGYNIKIKSVVNQAEIFIIAGKIKNRLLVMAGLFVVVLGTLGMPQWINEDYLAVSWLGEALGLFLMGTTLNI